MSSNTFVDIKSSIASILNIPNTNDWDVMDSRPDENLFLVHYKDGTEVKDEWVRNLRGVVVDTLNKVVVCKSYGYTPTVTSTKINDRFIFNDKNETIPLLEEDKFYMGIEGTAIRVFKHNGTVYFSTHRKLDFSRSRWGGSPTFKEIYESLKGPNASDLFDEGKLFSPAVHIFLLSHPQILIATKAPIDKGFIAYLGHSSMWENDGSIFPQNSVCEKYLNSGLINGEKNKFLPSEEGIYIPIPLSIEEANSHLTNGFYPPRKYKDPRMQAGEFVVMVRKNPSNGINTVIKIQSDSYAWRSSIRGNDPNIYHRFFVMNNLTYPPMNIKENIDFYIKTSPIFSVDIKNEISKKVKSGEKIVFWEQNERDSFNYSLIWGKDQRLVNNYYALIYSVPLSMQEKVVDFLDNFIEDRQSVINWLNHIYTEELFSNEKVTDRARNIIKVANDGAHKRLASGNNTDKKGRLLSVEQITKDNIRNFVMKEEGNSLYRLSVARKAFFQTLDNK